MQYLRNTLRLTFEEGVQMLKVSGLIPFPSQIIKRDPMSQMG